MFGTQTLWNENEYIFRTSIQVDLTRFPIYQTNGQFLSIQLELNVTISVITCVCVYLQLMQDLRPASFELMCVQIIQLNS